MDKFKITVFCEIQRNETAATVSYELASKAVQMAEGIENAEVQVIIVGKRMSYDNIIENFTTCGVNKIIVVNDNNLADYSSERYRKAVSEIIIKENPQIVLFGATVLGRDLAPLVATTLDTGLTADCTGLEISDGKLLATRPTFGGKLYATIVCKTLPQMATVRPGVFKIAAHLPRVSPDVRFEWVDTNEQPNFTELLAFFPFDKKSETNLQDAKIIVAGGRGMKTQENFYKLYELTRLLGGAVGASRAAVENKFADSSIQIGQTGKTVNAKIYLAFGISGMAQHMAGINSCDKIIAINNNPKAPIFKVADFGIVGDATQVVISLIRHIKRLKGE